MEITKNGSKPDNLPQLGDGRWIRGLAEKMAGLSRFMIERAAEIEDSGGEPAADRIEVPVRHLEGIEEINAAIGAALGRAEKEILTAQPDGPRPAPVLEAALESVQRQLAGGVGMRTLYQHTTRFDEATKEYVRQVTGYGVQVRTLDEFFDRIIIIDSAVAFIAENDDRTHAIAVTEPGVTRFLTGVFERAWDRAKEFPFVPLHAAKAARDVTPAIRESIIRLLSEGHSDKVVARRLGISERSLQAHVAALKEELNAHSRLHLGYLLGRSETVYML